MKIALIGGDTRMLTVARLLEIHGATLRCLCLPQGAPHPVDDLFSAVQGADAVILPLPATRDGVYPTASEQAKPPCLAAILSRAEDECLLLGGMLPPSLSDMAQQMGVEIADYYQSERLIDKNAALTAEAAIGMAMCDLPRSLRGTGVCIIGAGRIARHLCHLLLPFEPRLSLYARRAAAREPFAAQGIHTVPIEEGCPLRLPADTRIVFSTVPSLLFDKLATETLPRGLLFYDLGGGCIDPAAAAERGIGLPRSAGLPGRLSPESAGEYLFDEIRTIIHEKRGVLL